MTQPASNPMRKIRVEKVTLNIGAGESGPKLEKGKAILHDISRKKVVATLTKKRTTFGMAQKRPIGAKVTLRGRDAHALLEKLLKAVENKLKTSSFDSSGNFSFGIAEYIDIPGMKYNPDAGILGLDVCVTLERPGFRVKKKRIMKGRVGVGQRIKPEEAIEFVKREFGTHVV